MQSYTGNEKEFQRLLTDGANLNATDQNGNTALLLAAKSGNNSVMKDDLLVESNTKSNTICLSCLQEQRIW